MEVDVADGRSGKHPRRATTVFSLAGLQSRHGWLRSGTVQGGLLVELADAAIGTAQSTLVEPDEPFSSIDLKATFLRPVWNERLTATTYATHTGRTVSHCSCKIARGGGNPVATEASVRGLVGELAVRRQGSSISEDHGR